MLDGNPVHLRHHIGGAAETAVGGDHLHRHQPCIGHCAARGDTALADDDASHVGAMTVIVRGRAGAELGRTVVGAAAAALLGAEARLVDHACGPVGMTTVHTADDHRALAPHPAPPPRTTTP